MDFTLAWRHKQPKHVRKLGKQNGFKVRENRENILQPRIIGGRPAKWGEAPYYLRLETKQDGFTCGAALMNYRGLRFAATAAHCVWWGEKNQTDIWAATISPKYVQLIGADIDKDAYQPRDQVFQARGIVIHQKYDPRWFINDIALIFLREYAHESLGLERVQGPGIDWNDPRFATIVGHGAKHRFDPQRYLQSIEMEIMPRDICNLGILDQSMNYYGINATFGLQDSEFCLSHPVSWIQKGLCFGDSGGPVVAFNYSLQKWYLAGVVSFSSVQSCGSNGAFTMITKISHFVSWIKKHAEVWIELYGTGNPYTNGTPDNSDL